MELVSQDICTHEKKDYLITVCHFTDWIEVDELQDTLAATVISKTKAHFARFGIPQICHTDNGPQFACKEYYAPPNSSMQLSRPTARALIPITQSAEISSSLEPLETVTDSDTTSQADTHP